MTAADRAHRRGTGRRRGLREPARDTRHRAEDRRGAGHRGRHLAVREPPRAGGLLRGGARRQRVRHRHKVNLPAARGQQAAREPADIQPRPPRRDGEPVRKALRRARGEGDEAQQGAQGRREEEDEGRLRDHAGRGPVRAQSVALGDNLVGGGAPARVPMRCAEIERSPPLDKTIETPPIWTPFRCQSAQEIVRHLLTRFFMSLRSDSSSTDTTFADTARAPLVDDLLFSR